jgi:hypothetical protein
MLIAYLTVDEVNEDLALRLAEECGVTVYPLTAADPPPNGQFAAVLYDLDSLPSERREAVLAELRSGAPGCPVGVHSYDIDDGEAERLGHKGIAVGRRLESGLFTALRRLAEHARANGSQVVHWAHPPLQGAAGAGRRPG